MTAYPLRRAFSTLFFLLLAGPASAAFVTFESGQVRPLALSPDGSRLFAVNTPDDRLEIFDVSTGSLVHLDAVPVGLEPVAVAARTNGEVWVVNHLSDSVSIVDVSGAVPRVVRTLLVGDEPRDIVFAGTGGNRAFITCAHRGQNSFPADPLGGPQFTTAGIGRADVWVFDATNLGTSLGGTPVAGTPVVLFGDTPRALAVGNGGNTVYAAVFHSGNQTATVNEGAVCNGGGTAPPCNVQGVTMPGGLPKPNTNAAGVAGPETGLIVKFENGHWQDRLGRNWDPAVKFTLPDDDVFALNANGNPPAPTATFAHVGTVLFDMIVNPVSGKVYVTNTDARNEFRFEGPGTFASLPATGAPPGPKTVRGHLHEAHVTILDGANVIPRRLNKNIDYAVVPSPAGVKNNSLATPLGMAITSDGGTLYVAAFGSSKVGIFNTTTLENDMFVASASSHIPVTGGGPTGMVLDESNDRLYVLTRFDNAISVIDTNTAQELAGAAGHQPLSYNPEPTSVKIGRPILYDANLTSSNGEASCAACHIFGDFDSLGWDLGNPDDGVLNNPNPFQLGPFGDADFHPLKGPMTTQSLRGMANHGPMHWRGDRTGGNDPGGSALDENAAFLKFIVAFDGLLGRGSPISNADMQKFADFILQVTYPPNPVRNLDNSLTADQQTARNFYMGTISDVVETCNGCHVLDPANGFFGSKGFSSFENETQHFKVPHLRNMYQKVGMFGMPAIQFINTGDNGSKGAQVRGFGFLHDGAVDTLFRFHNATVFNGGFQPNGCDQACGDAKRRQMEQFMLAFDSNLAPIVGQQTTLTSTNAGTVGGRITLLINRAIAHECDVVVKGNFSGERRGWVGQVVGMTINFRSDRASEPLLNDATLRAQANAMGQELTYTCVPFGSGQRIGIDRDEDGFLDRTELDAGSDPADPLSIPGGATTTTSLATTTSTTSVPTTTTTIPPLLLIRTSSMKLKDNGTTDFDPKRKFSFKSSTKKDVPANRIPLPAPGSVLDPTVNDAFLFVYNAAGQTPDYYQLDLPSTGWRLLGTPSSPKAYKFSGKLIGGGPISSVTIKADSFKVKGGGFYTLNESSQGQIGVRLLLGGFSTWCAAAPAKPSGSPPSTTKNDHPGVFTAQPNTLAPVSCPPTP